MDPSDDPLPDRRTLAYNSELGRPHFAKRLDDGRLRGNRGPRPVEEQRLAAQLGYRYSRLPIVLKLLVDATATCARQLEAARARQAAGEAVDDEQVTRLTRSLNATLAQLGLDRESRDAKAAAEQEARDAAELAAIQARAAALRLAADPPPAPPAPIVPPPPPTAAPRVPTSVICQPPAARLSRPVTRVLSPPPARARLLSFELARLRRAIDDGAARRQAAAAKAQAIAAQAARDADARAADAAAAAAMRAECEAKEARYQAALADRRQITMAVPGSSPWMLGSQR
jgi:hypothetical protein